MSLAKDAAREIHGKHAFNVPFNPKRRKVNQHLTRYTFPDVSTLDVHTSGRYVARDGSGVRLEGAHNANTVGA